MSAARVERLEGFDWRPVASVAALEVGDVFRRFGPDGAPVADPLDGATRWRVTTRRDLPPDAEHPRGQVELDVVTVPDSDAERAVLDRGAYFPGDRFRPAARREGVPRRLK